MPLKIPNLDDRKFNDLVKEGLSLLPHYAPEWTNHNPSDPGITLIELLAYVTEILIFRLNRVTRENKIKFLQLLRNVAPDERRDLADPGTPVEAVDEALTKAVLGLREPRRAVTVEDHEKLAQTLAAAILSEEPRQVRTRCFVRRNLEAADRRVCMQDRPGHVSVVIVPGKPLEAAAFEDLLKDVRAALEPMRLLATRLHVVRPFYVWLSLGAIIRTKPGALLPEVQRHAVQRLQDHFSPYFEGGPGGEGWPFGRPVYLSEIYALLEAVEGVDYVEDVRVLHLAETRALNQDLQSAFGIQIGLRSTLGIDSRLGGETLIDKDRVMRDGLGRLIGIRIRAYELVRVVVAEDAVISSDLSMKT
ncbi:MAG: hypothetical protein V2I48_02340 [Xanthomonadales bacterium]|jgi:hypothetical protein|nr:hypothetical protein [Xanthomonadales bacterium]